MSDPDDPFDLRKDAPLLDGWLAFRATDIAPFTTPGHKQRTNLVGPLVRDDIPLYGGVDTIRQRAGMLAEADEKLARLWGADWGRISVGGSTHGNQTLALALCRPGDEVVVTRTLHRSLLLGMVLVGVTPVWVRPEVDPTTGLPTHVPVERVARALAEHPAARAVFLVEPTYVGTLSDVAGHAEVAHAHGIPLVVDQAWGAYFGFHPELPRHALQSGADAMVTSAHKTLPAHTQAALVLARTERIDRDRLDRAFEATATTSPSGSIAASADAARALLAREGERLLGQLLKLADHARERLRKVPGLVLLDDVVDRSVILDRAKFAINVSGTGASGLAVENHLIAAGLPVELADRDTIIPILSMNDDLEVVDRFVDGVIDAVERERSTPRPVLPSISWTVSPQVVVSPRDAFFAAHVTVPAEQAIGRVSAELVAPYPPGIPVLAPGERITREAVEGLRQAQADGTQVRYAADRTLRSFQVLAEG
ncbi:MAG: aminotransferase class V-fold PLP-dependent enzyme [Myxococcales bacterium]|nr:aminotransferase class V-fold PLP-dependent enzyme [Myxococcales bacterium]MDH5199218.1 aminotransferase class V-fold PLP-dependent enzyme [Gemmatimonadota bacterium]MDH5565469.1 aminotransferase class V-fold PLP-dependent enzyme [Myxococcales bacterium]